MISKKDQTHKVKSVSAKKMSKTEYKLYVEFINELADGLCQCNCGRAITAMHHSQRGSNKDDRSIGGINHLCHYTLHFSTDTQKREALTGSNKDDRSIGGINHLCHYTLHFSTDTQKREALTDWFKKIGEDNWRRYTK